MELADRWDAGDRENLRTETLIFALCLDRLCRIILPLENHPKAKVILGRLCGGNFDFLSRNPSKTKDYLWEVEAWSRIRTKFPGADFREPDIVFNPELPTGIACKKIYSGRQIAKRLKKAIEQIKASTKYGIVAFNLDDYAINENSILRVYEGTDSSRRLQDVNLRFLRTHESQLKRHFREGDLTAVMVSTSCLVQADRQREMVWNSQVAFWSLPSLSAEHRKRTDPAHDALTATI